MSPLQKGCVTLPVPVSSRRAYSPNGAAVFPGTARHTAPVSFGRAGVSGSDLHLRSWQVSAAQRRPRPA